MRPVAEARASSQPPATSKTVQFDLSPSSSDPNSPDKIRKRRHRSSNNDHDNEYDSDSSTLLDHDRHDRHNRRHHHEKSSHHDRGRSPSPAHSDSTVDLPERFDEDGRPLEHSGEDPLVHTIQDLIGGFLGGGDGHGGRRRRRG